MCKLNSLFASDVGVRALDPGSSGSETETVETVVVFKLPGVTKSVTFFENE